MGVFSITIYVDSVAYFLEGGEAAGEKALRADLVAGDTAEAQRTHRHYHFFMPPAYRDTGGQAAGC